MNAAAAQHWHRRLGLRGRFTEREPMARHCSWRTGGVAERYFEPADVDDLAHCLRGMPAAEPITWLGLGSNLLVRDGGLRGTVIATAGGLETLSREGEDRLRAGAGLACAKLARAAAQAGLAGAEFLAGIPGTVGGALAMNAGAFGDDTWSHVVEVETIDRHGERRLRAPRDFKIDYRSVRGPPGEWFLGGTLRFERATDAAGKEKIRALLAARNAAQPTGLPSCGSVFKNPPGDHAGRLIDAAGMKGARVGGCFVSDKHANFIINDGTATARDIEHLIATVQRTVRERFGVVLEPEVRIVGTATRGMDAP